MTIDFPPTTVVRLSRTRDKLHLVTLRPHTRPEPAMGSARFSVRGQLHQSVADAVAGSLQRGLNACIACDSLDQAMGVYSDLLDLQDGALERSDLPAGAL